jgi:hypothetical protein
MLLSNTNKSVMFGLIKQQICFASAVLPATSLFPCNAQEAVPLQQTLDLRAPVIVVESMQL